MPRLSGRTTSSSPDDAVADRSHPATIQVNGHDGSANSSICKGVPPGSGATRGPGCRSSACSSGSGALAGEGRDVAGDVPAVLERRDEDVRVADVVDQPA